MLPTPDTEPLAIRAGDSVAWVRNLSEYSAADGWALHYRLIPIGAGTPIDITATGSDTAHSVNLSAAVTAAWVPARYTRYTYVERTVAGPINERVSLGMSPIEIQPDLTTATSHDSRSANVKALEDLQAARAEYVASRGMVAAYTIGDRSITFRNVAEISALINVYQLAVNKERGVSGRVFYRG